MSDRTVSFLNEIGMVVYNVTAASFTFPVSYGKLLMWFNQKGGEVRLKIRDCYPILCFHAYIFPFIFRFLRMDYNSQKDG